MTAWPFPIKSDQFELPFSIRVLRPGATVLQKSDTWEEQLAYKRVLAQRREAYFQAADGTESIQAEAVEYLNRFSPEFRIRTGKGSAPLWEAGLQIQEDLILLESSAPFRMIAGAVFFPSGWSVRDKMGLSNMAIHAPVPGYRQFLHEKTERLLGGLKYARPVSRDNWGVRPTSRWDQLPEDEEVWSRPIPDINAENAGATCFFRGEYQTISRLKSSEAILFTIHSWQRPVGALSAEQSRFLLGTIKTCPPESLIYKGIQPFVQPLLSYLEQRLAKGP